MAVSVLPGAEPYAHDGNDIGVLLVHGYTSTPQSMRGWAEHLAAAGFTVRLPRLPGHGTRWQDMNTTRWQDWYAEVDRAFGELRSRCSSGVRRGDVDGRAPVDQGGPRAGAAGGRAHPRQPHLPARRQAARAAADAATRAPVVPGHRQRRQDGRRGARAGLRPEPAQGDALPDPAVGGGSPRPRRDHPAGAADALAGRPRGPRGQLGALPRAHLQHRRHRDLAGELVPRGNARQRRPADPR